MSPPPLAPARVDSIAVAIAAGHRLPLRLHWREVIVLSLAASAGFTFALFFAASVIPAGPLLNELKLGALSTAVSAVLAFAAARLLHVGRFSRQPGRGFQGQSWGRRSSA